MATKDVSEKLIKTLKALGYPIARMYYKGDADTYLTFRMLGAAPCAYSNDDYENFLYSFEVTLTTKQDYTNALNDLISILRNECYTISGIGAEMIDIDTGFFYVPITISILEE